MKKLLFLLMVGTCSTLWAAHPNSFLNQNEIEAIKAKVAAGQQPWKSAHSSMLSKANSALNQSPLSVTFSGSSSHDYKVTSPYNWSNNMPSPCGATHCDGLINPKADREDYSTVTKLGGAVRDLGLGYVFTGDSKYANKVIALIKVFCLDAGTYMTPKLGSNGIEHYITFPGLFYGADLIYNYSGWNASEKSAFLKWCTDFGNNIVGRHYSNNWEDWRQVFMGTVGQLTDNSSFKSNAWNNFKADLSGHIGNSGEMSKELGRTTSLSYSTYALVAMTEVAELAKHQGVDLYGYTVGSDNLEKAWDYHVQYVLNPSSWPREQIKTYNGANTALYELANNYKPKSTYQKVIAKYNMWESRVMGYTSLSHHFGLDVKPVVATPQISPNGGNHVGSVQVTITSSTGGADIRYTTNGNTPTSSSTQYSSSITLTSTTTIKAKAFKSGIDPSGVATASFTITVDNAAPKITSVSTGGDPTKVAVNFDELVDNASATNKSNYSIAGLTIASVTLNTGGKTVTLTVSTMTEGSNYTLNVSGIKDKAINPNTMGSINVNFSYNKSFEDNFDDKRLSWSVTTGSRWTVATDGSDKSYHINTSSYNPVSTSIPGEIATVNGLSVAEFELSVSAKSPSGESGNANRDYGVVFGYINATNFWYFLGNATASNNQLFQVTGGSRTEKLNLNSALITDNNYHTLKIVVQNGKIGIYQDGAKKGEVSAIVAEGKVGLCGYNDEVWFDDFLLVPLDGSQMLINLKVAGIADNMIHIPNPVNILMLNNLYQGDIYKLNGNIAFEINNLQGVYLIRVGDSGGSMTKTYLQKIVIVK